MLKQFQENEFLQVLQKLAITPGPSLNEKERLDYIKSFLDNSTIQYKSDKSGNIWVTLKEGDWSDTVVFDAHVDVVEKGYCDDVIIDDNRITGLGVGDNLTAVTMLLLLIKDVTHNKIALNYPLKILFSVGEEGEGNLKGVRQMVNDNPSAPKLFISFDISYTEYSKDGLGSNRYKVKVQCPGGHSWHDYGSPNAISRLLSFLQSVETDLDKRFQGTSFNIGGITGGKGINSIARNAEAIFEFRSIDPLNLEIIDKSIDNLVDIYNKGDTNLKIINLGKRPAALQTISTDLDKMIQEVYLNQGIKLEHMIRSTNINIPLSAGWASVCLGLCDCFNYHREDEYLERSSLPKGWEILKELLSIEI